MATPQGAGAPLAHSPCVRSAKAKRIESRNDFVFHHRADRGALPFRLEDSQIPRRFAGFGLGVAPAPELLLDLDQDASAAIGDALLVRKTPLRGSPGKVVPAEACVMNLVRNDAGKDRAHDRVARAPRA